MEKNISLDKQADLRTIASQRLGEMLQELGMSEEEFRDLNRWEKVAEIRQNIVQREKNDQNIDQEATEIGSNLDKHERKREIETIVGLKSRNEAIVKFKDSNSHETVKMEEMKKKYPNELIKFYEDQYFKDPSDTK